MPQNTNRNIDDVRNRQSDYEVHGDEIDKTEVDRVVLAPQVLLSSFRRHSLQLPTWVRSPELTVVFDLDETLVYNRGNRSSAILRPCVMDMLKAVRRQEHVEIVLWTASEKHTAIPVLNKLQSEGTIFDSTIFRDTSWFKNDSYYTKDLRLLGRDMGKVIIFDNSTACCKFNHENAVIVDDFEGNINKEDATMFNILIIVQSLLRGVRDGHKVGEILKSMSLANSNRVKESYYRLPPDWENKKLEGIDPIDIPPHGNFFIAKSRLDTY